MRSVLTILAGACCASLALAQPATRTETRSSSTTTASFHRMTTVVGTSFTVGTDNVGKVTDVVFNDAGCLEYVLVQDTDGFIVVPWSVVTVNFEQKTVTVQSSTITVDKLREARFAEGRLNFSDPSFRQKITSVYGSSAGRSGSGAAGTSGSRSGTSGSTGSGTANPDHKSGTTNPDNKGGTNPDKNPGTTTPDRKGGTATPDRTTTPKSGTTQPEKPGTTTPPDKNEKPATDNPRPATPKKDKDGGK